MTSNTPLSEGDQSLNLAQDSILSYNGPVWRALAKIGPLTLTTGISLVVGFNYYQGYYRRLRVPEGLIPLANLDLLIASIKVFLSLTIVMILAFHFDRAMRPLTRRIAIERNLLFSITLVGVLVLSDLFSLFSWQTLVCIVALSLVSLMAGYVSETMVELLFYRNPIVVYTLVSLAILLVTTVPTDRGQRDAERLIEGKPNGLLVNFYMVDEGSLYSGQQYVLIGQTEDLFVITLPTDDAPKNPVVMAIPERDVSGIQIVNR